MAAVFFCLEIRLMSSMFLKITHCERNICPLLIDTFSKLLNLPTKATLDNGVAIAISQV